MTSKEWKETYLELDAYFTDFLCKWRKHDFKYPEQYVQNQKIISDLMDFTHDVVFINDEIRELLLEGLAADQQHWMELTGLKTDTVYIRNISILLYKMQIKIQDSAK